MVLALRHENLIRHPNSVLLKRILLHIPHVALTTYSHSFMLSKLQDFPDSPARPGRGHNDFIVRSRVRHNSAARLALERLNA